MYTNLGCLTFLLSSALAACHLQIVPFNGSWKDITTADGRKANAYVPACVNANSPIVVGFHGLGFDKEQQPNYDHFFADAERECAVVVYPQGKYKAINVLGLAGYSWNAGGCCPDADMKPADDVGFTDELVAEIAKEFGANGNMVFASGISNGAMMAIRYGCASDRVKGVIAVAGPLVNGSGGDGGEMFTCTRPVPTLYFHGTKYPIYPYLGCNRTWAGYGHICPDLYKMGPGFAPQFPSVTEFIAGRRHLNGISPSDQGTTSFQNNSATCTSWGSLSNNVTLCKLEGMGHAWPDNDHMCNTPWTTCDNDVDATQEAWRFMNQHRSAPKTMLV